VSPSYETTTVCSSLVMVVVPETPSPGQSSLSRTWSSVTALTAPELMVMPSRETEPEPFHTVGPW